MTGKDYFNKLTPEEQAMFKKNMKYRFEPHMKKTFRVFLSLHAKKTSSTYYRW